ncbi:MAG: hypothetical protein IKC36_04695 [Clostridia bacterium]|nr:hypothetical protein [Clostridia bacterium]
MRNHVIKTALISFAAAVIAVVLFCAGCLVVAPSFASDAVYGMGMYGFSASLAEDAYNRKGDEESLCVLVERAITAEDHALLEKYGAAYLASEYFANKAKAPQNALYSGNYRGYVAGNVACAQYAGGKLNTALETAFASVDGYAEYNSVQYLMRAVISSGDKTAASSLRERLAEVSAEGESAQRVFADLDILDTFIGMAEN